MNLKIFNPGISFLSVITLMLLLAACEKDPFEASSGTFTDNRDGHIYKWVKIGNQIWMAENLAYVPYVCAPDSQCGIWIYGYNGQGAYGTNYHTYGCLYDWETAMEVCPDGWHLPTDEEWMELERFLGMEERELYWWACRGLKENIAGQLAAIGDKIWSENFIRTNKTNFSALPGGHRNNLGGGNFYFNSINTISPFWTSSESNQSYSISRTIFETGCIDRMEMNKYAGFYIRCIKN
jgi:uncharacterized protein (TIGR02145 family)